MKTNYTQTSREYRRQQEQLRNAAPELLEALKLGLLLIERIEANDTLDEHEQAFADAARAAIETATR
jgi:hypothetical protein